MPRASPVTAWNSQASLPSVHAGAFIDETAVLIGDVRIAEGAAVLPGVVLRADEGSPIVIGAGTNIQDGVIMHALLGTAVRVGERCSIAHGAIVHGPCELGEGCFVGFSSVLLKVRAGAGCFISHKALVQGVELPEGALVPAGAVITSQEQVGGLARVGEGEREFAREVVHVNHELCAGYRRQGAGRGPVG